MPVVAYIADDPLLKIYGEGKVRDADVDGDLSLQVDGEVGNAETNG